MSYLGKQPAYAPLVSADITNALGFTPIQLSSLSATQNLTYNSTTGQFTGPDLSSYLTSATAASTYLTQANAASTYQTQAGMSSYLTTSAASSTYLPLSGGTLAGNLSFSGTTRRITGDFSSNSPITDRILIQTSTANANTLWSILPSGTSTTSRFIAFNASDPTNAGAIQVSALSTDVRIQSFANGTATAIPLLLMIGGTTVATLGTNGNFGIGVSPASAAKLHVYGGESRLEGSSTFQSFYNASSTRVAYIGGSDTAFQINVDAAYPIEMYTNGTKRFTVGASGQFGIGTSPSYGTSGQAFISGGSGAAPSWGTLGVAGGGTGVATLTGIVKGNGTSAFSAATAETDYVTPTGSGTLTNKTISGGVYSGVVDQTGSVRGGLTALGAGTAIDCSSGNFFTRTVNGNVTFTVSNVPASRAYAFTLEIIHTSGTITWFSGLQWPNNTAPTLTTGKTHLFVFVTDDGGTTWRGASQINYNA